MVVEKNFVEIYTDGACHGNPGPGGWAAILLWNGTRKEISGFAPDTTNNKMELTAAIEALKALKKKALVKIYTDSNYLKQGITQWIQKWQRNNWNKGTVKNQELWLQLYELSIQFEIEWHWVKAHNGDLYNEQADQLARAAIKKNMH